MGVQSEYYVALMWRVKSISLRGKSAPKNARQPRSRAASRALPPARTHAHARPLSPLLVLESHLSRLTPLASSLVDRELARPSKNI